MAYTISSYMDFWLFDWLKLFIGQTIYEKKLMKVFLNVGYITPLYVNFCYGIYTLTWHLPIKLQHLFFVIFVKLLHFSSLVPTASMKNFLTSIIKLFSIFFDKLIQIIIPLSFNYILLYVIRILCALCFSPTIRAIKLVFNFVLLDFVKIAGTLVFLL